MRISTFNMEGVVHEGWLVKSPPEKRILKAKWRRRWFVLRHSGLLPGQFILEYFTDNTCKKQKGKIDLDQCEQVDAGLTFESKKTNYQYMFDIRTPKRIYYMVAETEADMNNWVDCICSVCGLKIHVEDGNDYFSPQDSAANPVITSCPSSVSTSASNLTVTKSSSNPYIPISECHTGKPVPNGNVPFGDGFGDLPKESPPPPPQNEWVGHERSLSGEFYDYPRPMHLLGAGETNAMSPDTSSDSTYKVPAHLKLSTSDINNSYSNTREGGDMWHTLPPRVNWQTHPKETFVPGHGTVPRRFSADKADAAAYDIVPPLHSINRNVECVRKEVQELANQFDKANIIEPTNTMHGSAAATEGFQSLNIVKAPPRPPKPSKLKDRHEYENFELPLQAAKFDDSTTYDVPQSAKCVSINKQHPAQSISHLKKESGDELSPATKVPLSSSVGNEPLVDDTYDFPKFRSEDNIHATVPPPKGTGTSQRHRRHAYTNAPPGLFNSKELIFNYEYRPSLMTGDGYVNMDTKSELYASGDVSASVIGPYVNVPASPSFLGGCQNDAPPTVNRGLKPRRDIVSKDRGTFSFLTLQPPPVCRSRTKANERSFRKPRAAPSPTLHSGMNGTPPVPNRFRHHPEISTTSDDELSSSGGSRRNSSNDEQARHFFTTAPCKRDEIQYLDLDLDSEPSPSPKSPERLSASTVYKKVDFVKTKAFNEMRQNVEESYRKSQ